MKFIDLTGQRFGKLTVAARMPSSRTGQTRWLCHCDCGKAKIVQAGNLKTGHVASCGCLARHGLTKTPTYASWTAMINRCTNPRNPNYPNYGGRGITVCERWRNSFLDFLDDVGERPSLEHSIDRINNYGNYEPGNCKWSTATEQNNNRRRPRRGVILEHGGEVHCIRDWAALTGIKEMTLGHRIRKGLPAEVALTKPVDPAKSRAGVLSRMKNKEVSHSGAFATS
jgi:hypothetical protein